MIQIQSSRIGDLVRVQHRDGSYPLPEGLPDGSEVHLMGVVQTDRLVEWEGQLFVVSMSDLAPVLAADAAAGGGNRW